jgi:hypothetical protein
MDIQMDNKIDFQCKVCNKAYSSYKSLWNHNKKFHSNNVEKPVEIVEKPVEIVEKPVEKNKSLICESCNKLFNSRSAKSHHKKVCKQKDQIITISKNEIETLKNTINEMKEQFALILKEKGKMHHKTLQKINNQLTNTINNTNSHNNSHNNINSGNIINNIFVKFGDLEYQKVFNNRQIRQILNKQYHSLEESIKLTHFNEALPEYGNIFITNMKDDLAYVFDGKQFISVRKNEMLNELIDTHVKEINLSLEKNKNKINEKYVVRLEKFLDMLNDDDTTFTDQNNQRTLCFSKEKLKLL